MNTSAGVRLLPIPGLPLVAPGDDLGQLVAAAMVACTVVPSDGDVLVIAQKVVSKAEGRLVRLDDIVPSEASRALADKTGKPAALCELILSESAEVMRVRKELIIVRHRLGTVCANAGIDSSNVADPTGPETVLLWPLDPDASAARLRMTLEQIFKVQIAVVVSDSLGRAWRIGTVGTAIGVSGLAALRDRRGEQDLFGRTLLATVVGVADEIAAAASLVMGEGGEGLPACLVRGAAFTRSLDSTIAQIVRPVEEDLFP